MVSAAAIVEASGEASLRGLPLRSGTAYSGRCDRAPATASYAATLTIAMTRVAAVGEAAAVRMAVSIVAFQSITTSARWACLPGRPAMTAASEAGVIGGAADISRRSSNRSTFADN